MGHLFEISKAYLGANQVCMIGSFIIIATMSCERYFNIMAYTGTMCRCNFLTKKIANIFTWTAVWIIATCLSMPILINSRIIQVREQIQCKVTWEYVPKDVCEDQVYSQLISMDESMRTNITNCTQSGISKCSLGTISIAHFRSNNGHFRSNMKLKPIKDLSTSERIYWTVLFLIGFFIPVLLTLCSYTGLLYYVRQIKDALDKQGNSSKNNKVEIIIIRSSIIFTITVTITWIPLILFVSKMSHLKVYIDVFDGCWRPNVLVTQVGDQICSLQV